MAQSTPLLLGSIDQLSPEQPLLVRAGDRLLILVRLGPDVVALEATCACGGTLRPVPGGRGTLRCGRRGCLYDLRRGEQIGVPAHRLRRWPVEVREALVYVELRPVPLLSRVVSRLLRGESLKAGPPLVWSPRAGRYRTWMCSQDGRGMVVMPARRVRPG